MVYKGCDEEYAEQVTAEHKILVKNGNSKPRLDLHHKRVCERIRKETACRKITKNSMTWPMQNTSSIGCNGMVFDGTVDMLKSGFSDRGSDKLFNVHSSLLHLCQIQIVFLFCENIFRKAEDRYFNTSLTPLRKWDEKSGIHVRNGHLGSSQPVATVPDVLSV